MNYPPGALNDSRAPWNEKSYKPREWKGNEEFSFRNYFGDEFTERLDYRAIEVGFDEVSVEVQLPECEGQVSFENLRAYAHDTLSYVLPSALYIRSIDFF